jgi:hypothetical protein
VTWALERAPNPRVIRVHTTVELTRATIEKCPPASPPEGLRSLLAVDGVRSIDLHRYRARLNLSPGCDAKAAWEGVARTIEAAWGAPAPLPDEPPPRAFEVAYEGPRIVAESPEMAGPDPTLAALFRSPGWPRPSSRVAGYGSGRAVCSPGRTWRPRSAGLCTVPSGRGASLHAISMSFDVSPDREPGTSPRRSTMKGSTGLRGVDPREECSRCESGSRHPSR